MFFIYPHTCEPGYTEKNGTRTPKVGGEEKGSKRRENHMRASK